MLASGDTSDTKSIHYLLVDDHFGFRQLIVKFLGIDSDHYRESCNGREAIDACMDQLPDVILMDVEMPEVDGLKATREIKAQFPDVRIFILTQHDNPLYRQAAEEAGANGFFLKNDLRELVQLLRS